MMIRKIFTYTLLTLIVCSCGGTSKSPSSQGGDLDSMHCARGIAIAHHPNYTSVEIRNPWDTTRLMRRYLLVDRSLDKLPQNMGRGEVIRTPIKRAVVYTSVHASIIEMLHAEEAIAGVCEVQYIDSKPLQQRIADGNIADLGESTSPNIEKILDSGAEIIISSPFKDTGYGAAEKLGIPIVEGADYMESHPLGRVEWIKFYGMLFGTEKIACEIFDATSSEYLQLKALTRNVEHRPTIFADTKYGGAWFVAGGDSYSAQLFADAGGDYIFSSLKGSGSVQLSFEEVLERAIDADFWLIKYFRQTDMNYSALKQEYEPYQNFGAFKRKAIYGCNTSHIKYYELTPMHPQHLLRDLIHILHPSLLPEHKATFYTPLQE